MNTVYRIRVKDVDQALDFGERMSANVKKFLDKYPDHSYSQEISKTEDGQWAVTISLNDGQQDEKQVFKDFEQLGEAFGAL